MPSHDHPLFQRYPLNGQARLSIGEVPTPYHIYAGYGAFIGGTADFALVQRLLKNEQVVPVQTAHGRALLGIWVCNFTDASLGPHTELQFSVFVAQHRLSDLSAHPLGLLAGMLTRLDVQMLCHGLWNNTPTVIAYNRELLSLDARLAESQMVRDGHRFRFVFRDAASDAPIFSGELSQPGRASLRATLALGAQIGFGRARALAQAPWVGMQILNPLGVSLPHNAVAEAYSKNDVNAVRYWNPRADSIQFGDGPYARLQFTPHFIQHMDGFKFVYLNPR
jgi:hypothetical protein